MKPRMKSCQQTVDLPPLSRSASIQPGSVNEEKRTVDLVWTTGARVLRGFFDRFWEELSLDPAHVRMGRLMNGAPLLNAHDDMNAGSVIGVVENARLDGKQGMATVRFAKAEDDPAADQIFRKVKDGILKKVSVGYRTYKSEKVEDGADKIPIYRAIDWEPYELSVVPMGADDGAGIRSADQTRAPNKCVFVTRQETQMEPDPTTTTTEPEASAAVQATREAREALVMDAKARAEAERKAAEDAVAAERKRTVEIRKIAKQSGLGDAWADKMIEGNVTANEARKLAFDHVANRDRKDPPEDPFLHVVGGDDEGSKFVRGAAAWLFESGGVRGMIAEAAKKFPEKFQDIALDPGEFRGLKLYELARKSLERRGVSTRGMSPMTMVGQAFTYRASYQTVGDFPVLLENTMNKTLMAAYALQTDTWSRFCRADTVADFRPSNRYRTGSLNTLDLVPEHGEFKNKTVPDGQKMTVSTQTYGNIIALSRQTIINDDMGALTDMAMKLGRAAKLTIESAVYALITANSGLGPTQSDSQPFFHSNRANVNATGSALTAAGIDADRVVMGAQKDVNNVDYIDLRPSVLLVASGLGATARVLNAAIYDPIASTFQKPNPVGGLFSDVVDTPRLTGTRRYILADPSVAPIIVVAFLEGQGQAPMVDAVNGWRVDGVEWKVRLDAKAQMFDPKGGVTNAGA